MTDIYGSTLLSNEIDASQGRFDLYLVDSKAFYHNGTVNESGHHQCYLVEAGAYSPVLLNPIRILAGVARRWRRSELIDCRGRVDPGCSV